MTIKDLVNELNKLVEAGYGEAKATIGIPTLYVSEDGDVENNYYCDETEDFEFSAKFYIENKNIDKELNEIKLHQSYYNTCSCWDFYDDRKECEGED